jgi:phytoene dehydrogenase-like protein
MGGITQALASAARAHGAEIKLNSPVAKILTRHGRVKGVALADGTEFQARKVASNADAHVTYLQLVDGDVLEPEFLADVKAIDYSSASFKINVALSELPDFTAVRGSGLAPNTHIRGTIHMAPTLDYMERAYDDAKYGRPSADPILECTIPSVVDTTVAPTGKHVMSFFVQYAPYQLRGTTWDEAKDKFADRCFDILNDYAPNFKRSVIDRQVLSPLDLERRFGLTGGNIFQGAMTLSQLFFLRPLPGYADYRSPIKGLYLCGSATHPGGGVMGACGYNAAREILKDR